MKKEDILTDKFSRKFQKNNMKQEITKELILNKLLANDLKFDINTIYFYLKEKTGKEIPILGFALTGLTLSDLGNEVLDFEIKIIYRGEAEDPKYNEKYQFLGKNIHVEIIPSVLLYQQIKKTNPRYIEILFSFVNEYGYFCDVDFSLRVEKIYANFFNKDSYDILNSYISFFDDEVQKTKKDTESKALEVCNFSFEKVKKRVLNLKKILIEMEVLVKEETLVYPILNTKEINNILETENLFVLVEMVLKIKKNKESLEKKLLCSLENQFQN